MPLPNPYNLGLDWYERAIEAIQDTIFDFESLDAWKGFYGGAKPLRGLPAYQFRPASAVFDRNRSQYESVVDDYMWEKY